jgi:hypothetical protein
MIRHYRYDGDNKGAPDLKTVTRCVADLPSLLEESTLTERKSFIRSFAKEIKVTGDEVLLTYNMPLPLEEIPEERVAVLPIDTPGGEGGTRTPTHRCTRS